MTIPVHVEGIGPLEFEDGTPPDVIQATVKRLIAQGPNPTAGMSSGEKFLAGAGQAMTSAGRAIKQAVDVPAQALERTFGQFQPFGMPTAAQSAQETGANIAEAQRLDAPLLATPQGTAGSIVGNTAAYVPTMFIPGANTMLGGTLIGAGSSALMTPGGLGERGIAGLWGGGGALAGSAAGNLLSRFAGRGGAAMSQAALEEQAANAVRDATLTEGQKLGLVVAPNTVNQSALGRVLESFGGKAQTAQTMSLKNATQADNIVRDSIGLSRTTPLTKDVLQTQIRNVEGQVYKKIANTPAGPTDAVYKQDLLQFSGLSDAIKTNFPKLDVQQDIRKLADSLAVDELNPKAALELIKKYRAEGSAALKSRLQYDPSVEALGHAKIAAANMLEDQVKRNLQAQGKAALAESFDAARTRIAKTYTVQNALNEGTGHVDPRNIASQLKKGAPLSGDLETLARFGAAFPQSVQPIRGSVGVSALDVAGGVASGLGAAMLPNENDANRAWYPWMAAAAFPLLRAGARTGLASQVGQRMFASAPSYAPGLLGSTTYDILGGAGRLGMPLGIAGAEMLRPYPGQ